MSAKFKDVFNSSDFNINNPKLEEFLNKTRDVAETVGRKSAEGIDISRKRIECLDCKTKLAKAYEKFGRLQFKSYNGEEADSIELEELAGEIRMLNNKIDALNIEIEEAKANFNESMASVVQKTRDAFQKDAPDEAAEDFEVEVTEATEATE